MRVDRTDNTPLQTLARWRTGEPLRESKLNATVDTLNAIRQGVRPPKQVRPIRGGAAEAAEAAIERLVFLQSHGHDRIICRTDPNDADTAIYIAKPHQLRRTPWRDTGRPWYDAVRITYEYFDTPGHRLATMDGITEEQRITPSYMTGDPILIRKVSAEMIWGQGSRELEDVEWLDMQYPTPREWAAVLDLP